MTVRWRSALFVAANDEPRLAKIASRAADAVILDLEDAVAEEDKAHARSNLAAGFDQIGDASAAIVRINAPWLMAIDDLRAAVPLAPAAVMVPKAQDAARLESIGAISAELADASGVAAPGLIALIESPRGLAALDEIAAVPGLVGLAFGSEDFALAMRVKPTPALLDLACRQTAFAAACHDLMAFAVPVSIGTIADEQAWLAGLELARSFGASGSLCIHPRQVDAANRVFAPSPADIIAANDLLSAWARAGRPAVFRHDGKMIDRPVLLAAQRVAAVAGQMVHQS